MELVVELVVEKYLGFTLNHTLRSVHGAAAQKARSSPLYIPRRRFPDAGAFCYPFAHPLRRNCRRRFASTRSSWGWLKAETLTRTVPFSRVPAV